MYPIAFHIGNFAVHWYGIFIGIGFLASFGLLMYLKQYAKLTSDQIYNIAIASEFRRKGIGEALLRHLIDKADADGCKLVTLEVRSGNEAAMELYKKLGFREVGRRKGYYAKGGEDAVLMDLDLGKVEVEVAL